MFKRLGFLLAGLMLVPLSHAADATTPGGPAAWEAGKNYFLVEPPQATSGDKIEVLEVFSYACPHCAHFQPYAEQIKQSLPAYAKFDYMPAIFNPQWEPYARAYYAAQSLGVLEQTHQPLFDALHRDHTPLRTIEDLATFYGQHGVDRAKFLSAASSMETESRMAQSRAFVRDTGIDGTPSIIVAGKYRLTGASAGGYPQMIALVDFLVKKEHDARAKPAGAAKKK